jgi:hypothetical protein
MVKRKKREKIIRPSRNDRNVILKLRHKGAQMSMYCKVKRENQTVFVFTAPLETYQVIKVCSGCVLLCFFLSSHDALFFSVLQKKYADIVDEPLASVKFFDPNTFEELDNDQTVQQANLTTGFVILATHGPEPAPKR